VAQLRPAVVAALLQRVPCPAPAVASPPRVIWKTPPATPPNPRRREPRSVEAPSLAATYSPQQEPMFLQQSRRRHAVVLIVPKAAFIVVSRAGSDVCRRRYSAASRSEVIYAPVLGVTARSRREV